MKNWKPLLYENDLLLLVCTVFSPAAFKVENRNAENWSFKVFHVCSCRNRYWWHSTNRYLIWTACWHIKDADPEIGALEKQLQSHTETVKWFMDMSLLVQCHMMIFSALLTYVKSHQFYLYIQKTTTISSCWLTDVMSVLFHRQVHLLTVRCCVKLIVYNATVEEHGSDRCSHDCYWLSHAHIWDTW